MPLFYHKSVYDVLTHLFTMILLCTHDRPIDGEVGVARRRNCIFYNGFNHLAFLARPQGTGLKTQAGGHARPYNPCAQQSDKSEFTGMSDEGLGMRERKQYALPLGLFSVFLKEN